MFVERMKESVKGIHRSRARVRLFGIALFFAATAPADWCSAQSPLECEQSWPLRRALIMYTHSAAPTDLLDRIADRFEFSFEGHRPDIEYMINRNSKFRSFISYNSLTDNYVDGSSEHEWLFANASQYGVTGEDAYIHFREDTVVSLEGQNITIPGWNPNWSSGDPPATASSRAESRVPVYFADLRRRAVNFGSQGVRDLNIAYNVQTLTQPAVGGIHPGGIFFDNSANMSLRVSVVSGGAVAEHPAHAKLNSSEFVDWYWTDGAGVFLAALRDYIDANPGQFDNREILIAPNVANTPHIESSNWENSYVFPPVGHVLTLEFEYNPTRDFGMGLPRTIFEKHTQALANDVSIFETGYTFKGRSGLTGSYTDEEATMNTLASHWVHRADDAGSRATTYLLGVNSWDLVNDRARWDLNLAPAFDFDLGRPQGAPMLLDSGVDGEGNSYQVWGRALMCGFAVVRHRDPYDGNFGETTAVTFDLGGEYSPVSLMGLVGRPVTTWTLRNGEGQIFVASGTVPRDDVPPGAPQNLREEQQ